MSTSDTQLAHTFPDLTEEIAAAEKTAQATIVQILSRVSEQDLQEARNQGLLTPEDHQEALKSKRTLNLKKSRSANRELEQEV